MMDLKVAMVGAGNMIEAHILAFQAQENVKIVGITNRTRTKANILAEKYGVEYVANSIKELMDTCKPDLVVMAVYEPAITKIAREIFGYDCAVLMEKPLGLNLNEADQLVVWANARDKPVFVGLNRRAMESTRTALEDLDGRQERRFIHIQDQQSLDKARAIGHAEVVVENWMYANSIHLVDYAFTFGRGYVTQVKILEPWKPEAPDIVVAHITFSSGDTALYQALWNGPGPWSCTISTFSKRWELRPLENLQFQNYGERTINEVKFSDIFSEYKPGFLFQAKQVCLALRGHNSTAVSAQEAVKSVQLLKRIYS
ncbi:Gfo/Idh/MocA family oxidoreductase [Hellea sp.]|nr:Gfo/Idh/MocA family oxidoreductase [Hellea sp.]MDB4843918.1 Gfo/Idh/MocA family oxidoreductase [Hellea sp.]MDC0651468.1 Gfo/Idh/MocA family oxidoreductase [Hellea sp.]MDC1061716.1 Gfo/Idh/MocA family oxidoreductase [Hellea sp.]